MATDLGFCLHAFSSVPRVFSRSGGTETNRSLALPIDLRQTPTARSSNEVGLSSLGYEASGMRLWRLSCMSVRILVARLPLDVRDFRLVLARLLERMSRPGTAHIRPLAAICPVCKVWPCDPSAALHMAAVCAFVVLLAAGVAKCAADQCGHQPLVLMLRH